jgi:hypothetical protein
LQGIREPDILARVVRERGARGPERVYTVDAMTLQHTILWVSAAALIGPFVRLIWVLLREAFPRAIRVIDSEGNVIGTISAESVQKSDASELARLHERIRREHHVTTEAA